MRLRAVPYYYLHLFNDIGPVHDEEGHEYPDLAAALAATGTVKSDLLVVAASGVDSDDNAIVGKAIWEGRFTVAEGLCHARG